MIKRNFDTIILLAIIFLGLFFIIRTAIGFYSSTAAYQTIYDTSTNVPALSYRVQGIASSTVNTFVNQIWKLKIKAAIGNRFQCGLYWAGGAAANNIDFLTDGTVISSSTGVTALTKDGDFYTISYSAFQPTGDVFIQFRPIGSSADIYGTDTNDYEEGAFCETGNDPYSEGCPPSSLIDAYFIFSETGETPP
ncbi:hypothetical protein KAU19_08465, partial [Candidatus Parcubacteria bacterium]|nr:hypothetical protein [Candidatus Parcubacteria bacterium]